MHRPSFYAERFQRFMCNTAFKKIPCKYLHAAVPLAIAMVSGFSLLSSCGLGRWTKAFRKSVVLCHPFLPPRLFLPHRCDFIGTVSSISLFLQGTALAPDSYWQVAALGFLLLPERVRKVLSWFLSLSKAIAF